MLNVIRQPDGVKFGFEDGSLVAQGGGRVEMGGASLTIEQEQGGLRLVLEGTQRPLCHIVLRWKQPIGTVRVLGDHWERGYGDLEWRGLVPERVLPWFFLISRAGETAGAGVQVHAGALCWTCAAAARALCGVRGWSFAACGRLNPCRERAPLLRRGVWRARCAPCAACPRRRSMAATTGTMPMATAAARRFCRTRAASRS